MLGEVIGPEQSAFIKDRQILDNFLVANELIHFMKSSGNKSFLFKVNFQKTFDTVSWNYLDFVLSFMNFGKKKKKKNGDPRSVLAYSLIEFLSWSMTTLYQRFLLQEVYNKVTLYPHFCTLMNLKVFLAS